MKKREIAARRRLEAKLRHEVNEMMYLLTCLKVAVHPKTEVRPEAAAMVNLVRQTEKSFLKVIALAGKAAERQCR